MTLILVATLLPAGDVDRLPSFCIACGDRGLADFLLNVALFMPFGASLAARGEESARALVLGLLLSTSVEVAQMWIPGRQPALGDVTANGIGALLGAWVLFWVRARGRRISAAIVVMLALAVFAATGWLLRPSYPHSVYYGQWTAHLGQFEHYTGQVLQARIGTEPLPSGRVPNSQRLRGALSGGAGVSFEMRAGMRPDGLAPIVSIFDGRQREILVIGAEDGDLVVRRRLRASAVRLSTQALRFVGALDSLRAGERVSVTISTSGSRLMARVGDRTAASTAFTLGSGWGLLYTPDVHDALVRMLLDALWVAAWFLLAGLVANGGRPAVFASVVLGAALAGLPTALGLASTPPREWIGAVVGAGLALLIARVLRPQEDSGKRVQ